MASGSQLQVAKLAQMCPAVASVNPSEAPGSSSAATRVKLPGEAPGSSSQVKLPGQAPGSKPRSKPGSKPGWSTL